MILFISLSIFTERSNLKPNIISKYLSKPVWSQRKPSGTLESRWMPDGFLNHLDQIIYSTVKFIWEMVSTGGKIALRLSSSLLKFILTIIQILNGEVKMEWHLWARSGRKLKLHSCSYITCHMPHSPHLPFARSQFGSLFKLQETPDSSTDNAAAALLSSIVFYSHYILSLFVVMCLAILESKSVSVFWKGGWLYSWNTGSDHQASPGKGIGLSSPGQVWWAPWQVKRQVCGVLTLERNVHTVSEMSDKCCCVPDAS